MALERYSGDQAEIAWKQESTFGSKPSSIDRFAGAISLETGKSQESSPIQTADGTRVPQTVVYGNEEAGGTIPGTLQDGRIFMWALGDPNTKSSNESGNSNLHEYRSRFNPISFAFQVDMDEPSSLDDLNRHILGCVCSGLTISIPEGDGEIEYDLSYEAKESKTVSDGSLDSIESYSGREPFVGDEVTYKVNGSSRTDIMTCDIQFNIDQTERHNSAGSSKAYLSKLISPGQLTPKMELEVLFEDTFWHDKFKNRTKLDSITVDIEKTGNRDDHIIVTFKNLTVDEVPMDIPEQGDVRGPVTVTADTIEVDVHDDFTH